MVQFFFHFFFPLPTRSAQASLRLQCLAVFGCIQGEARGCGLVRTLVIHSGRSCGHVLAFGEAALELFYQGRPSNRNNAVERVHHKQRLLQSAVVEVRKQVRAEAQKREALPVNLAVLKPGTPGRGRKIYRGQPYVSRVKRVR